MVVWKDRRRPNDKPLFTELYDHDLDPDETVNIAMDQPEVVTKLMVQFDEGWKGNLPDSN
jgi:hypothetical protein